MDRHAYTVDFTDLSPELERILDNFSTIFDIRIAYYLPDGREAKIGCNRMNSPYCTLLRERLGYESKCTALDREKRKLAAETGNIQPYVCHGGCTEVVKPIFDDRRLLGFIMIGQTAIRPHVPEAVMEIARRNGEVKTVIERYRQLPFYDRERMGSIIELFSELTDLIMAKNLVRIKESGPVQTVVEHMKRSGQPMTLRQAAEMTNLSESRLRHRFLEELGETFTQAKLRICMERAWNLLKSDDSLSVQEVAYRVGFRDELYFSKVFRSFFGCPPSKIGNYFTPPAEQ